MSWCLWNCLAPPFAGLLLRGRNMQYRRSSRFVSPRAHNSLPLMTLLYNALRCTLRNHIWMCLLLMNACSALFDPA